MSPMVRRAMRLVFRAVLFMAGFALAVVGGCSACRTAIALGGSVGGQEWRFVDDAFLASPIVAASCVFFEASMWAAFGVFLVVISAFPKVRKRMAALRLLKWCGLSVILFGGGILWGAVDARSWQDPAWLILLLFGALAVFFGFVLCLGTGNMMRWKRSAELNGRG